MTVSIKETTNETAPHDLAGLRPAHFDRQALIVEDPLQQFVADLPRELRDPRSEVAAPIAEGGNATTFGARSLEEFAALKYREMLGLLHVNEAEYFRYGTPITRRVEQQLAALDGGEVAAVFRSGMAAIDTLIDALVPVSREIPHFIVAREGYRQTRNLLDRLVARGHAELTEVAMEDFNNLDGLIQPHTKAIFFETPSNPFLKVVDIARVREQVHAANSDALIIVDHTFANPYNQKPLEQGADVVVPSLTKYVGGNNKVAAGAVIGRGEILARVLEYRGQKGNIASDGDCLGVEEGLLSLEDRNALSNGNGIAVATFLNEHPLVERVWYPGLPSHPDYDVAARQMPGGFGGVVSFCIAARDFHDVAAFIDTFIAESGDETFLAPSFGGEAPIISSVPIVSHFRQSAAERAERGIPDNLVRLSVGNGESAALLCALTRAFDSLRRKLGDAEAPSSR